MYICKCSRRRACERIGYASSVLLSLAISLLFEVATKELRDDSLFLALVIPLMGDPTLPDGNVTTQYTIAAQKFKRLHNAHLVPLRHLLMDHFA